MTNAIEGDKLTAAGQVGHSAARRGEDAGRESVREALGGRTPTSDDLVLIFPSSGYDLPALHEGAMAEAGTAEVVGATTVGAFTHEAQVPFGCVAIFLSGEQASFGVRHVERDDADVGGCTRMAAQAARDRAGAAHTHSVLMLMCDALTPDQHAMARGAYEVTGALVQLVGGVAADDLRFEATYTFGEGRLLSNGIVCVWINSPAAMAVTVDHGWRPFGKPLLVTRAEGSVIHELDGEPALDVYLAERGPPLWDGLSWSARFQERPIGLPNARGGYDLRQIEDQRDDGGLGLSTVIPEQTVCQIMASDGDSLLDGARQAANAALQELDASPRMAVVFSCSTRAALLGERIGEEVALISSILGDVPAGGFYTCGEFARVPGSIGIHNSSVAILTL